MSTPRDFNQPPWPPRPNPGPSPRPGPRYPQQGRPPWNPPAAQWNPPPGHQPGQRAQPPGPWGQPSPPPPPSPSKTGGSNRRIFLITGAIIAVIIVVAVAVVLVSKAGNKDVKKIAVADVQTEVRQILLDRITGYDSGDIKDVKCNNGQNPTVKKGGSFACDVTVRGKQHRLTVTFQDANGTYWVGLPELEGGK